MQDIVANVPAALAVDEAVKQALFRVARERYDWTGVAAKLLREMEAM